MKKEVYCKGCRYFSWDCCEHPSNVTRDYEGDNVFKSSPGNINESKNCSNHQKKKTLKEKFWSFVGRFV